MMKVRVLFFSVLRDVTGIGEMSWELVANATVGELLTELFERWPKLQDWDESLLIAVDETYVKRNEPLHENAEVAIMPPVQGG